MELSRRRFLGGMGAVAAGVALDACAGGKSRHAAGNNPFISLTTRFTSS